MLVPLNVMNLCMICNFIRYWFVKFLVYSTSWREQNFVFNKKIWLIIIFFTLNLLFESELYFSSYLHDKYCILASILLTTYKRIEQVNKLTRKYNIFMSMTWKFGYWYWYLSFSSNQGFGLVKLQQQTKMFCRFIAQF